MKTSKRPMFATYKCPGCGETFAMSAFDWQWHRMAGVIFGGCAANGPAPQRMEGNTVLA